jgi:hypothetical protein
VIDWSKGTPVPASRRLPVIEYMVTALQKLAAMRGLAMVILTPCATRMQAEQGATLTPAINARSWEQGISTRIALFRDWLRHDEQLSGARFAALMKSSGTGIRYLTSDKMDAFELSEVGSPGPPVLLFFLPP